MLVAGAAMAGGGCSQSSQPPQANKPAASAPAEEPFKITQFYAAAPELAKGEKALLCYGVEHAKSVWLSPPRQELAPSPTRCIEVAPEKTTTYTLTAENGRGQSATQTVTIQVGAAKPPQVRIEEVTVTSLTIKPGGQVGICYKVRNANSIHISPGGYRSGPGDHGCTVEHPGHTTTYVVAATGAAGDHDEEKVTVTVKQAP